MQAYVRGAVVGNAENCELESSTAVFTKRRYRDRWNRIIVRRVAGTHNHTLKIKARLRAKGVRGQQYYSEAKTSWIRKRARTQNLWLLQLAGDWHPCHEVKTPHTRPHLMRCMLVSNLAVDQRFANGTQGRMMFISCDRLEKVITSSGGVFLRAGKPLLDGHWAAYPTALPSGPTRRPFLAGQK